MKTLKIFKDTNTWSAAASIPVGVQQHSAVTVNDNIYVIGGRIGGSPGTATNLVQIYNTNTSTWSAGSNMPVTINQFGAYAVGTNIYIVGGKDNSGNFCTPIFSEVWIYDTVNDSWSAGPSLSQPTG
mgnify:CR=1 FL=1